MGAEDLPARLERVLRENPAILADVLHRLGLHLTCEGCGTGQVLWSTPAMTRYHWDGTGDDPNAPKHLCPECSEEHIEHWTAMWREYHGGLL